MFVLFWILEKTIPLFPLKFIQGIARLKGKLFYYLLPIRRSTARSNLKRAFPDKTEEEINRIVKGCYVNVLTVIAEFFYMQKMAANEMQRFMRFANEELYLEKVKEGKGVIIISGHFGNWELTAFGSNKLTGVKLNVVVKEQTNRKVNEGINRIRTSNGNKMIDMRNSLRAILTALKAGEVVAMLGDQSAPKENVKVNFFIKDVPTFEGTARIALKTRANVLFVVSVRQNDGTYLLKFHVIDISKYNGSSEENIKALTQEHVNLLVQYISAFPDQWLWFHKRFKNAA